MSNIKYVLKTGNPKESAGKDKTAFNLRKKALKKPHPVKIDLLVTNGKERNKLAVARNHELKEADLL